VVDRISALGDFLDGKDRKLIDLVVVAGVITERPFRRRLAGVKKSLQNNFCARRNLEIGEQAIGDLRL